MTLHKLQSKAVEGWLVGIQASNIYRVWIPQIDRVIVSRDVRVDEAIKYTPNMAKNMIPINSRKIITILEQDIDEQEIEELIREKQRECQIDIIDDNDILPVKITKAGLPTPPPSDGAVDQSGSITTPTTTGTTTPQSTQSSHHSPSPQHHKPVSEAVPI